jgi:hypothetical protein
MKTVISRKTAVFIFIFACFFLSEAHAQVGINTTSPTETLHVNGNVRIDGALMPGNQAGGVDKILVSKGTSAPPSWGPGFLNISSITDIGRFYVGPFNISSSYLEFTVTDANMTVGSTIFVSFVGDLPTDPLNPGQPYYGDLSITTEARNGEFKLHIANNTGYTFTNMQLSFVALYN